MGGRKEKERQKLERKLTEGEGEREKNKTLRICFNTCWKNNNNTAEKTQQRRPRSEPVHTLAPSPGPQESPRTTSRWGHQPMAGKVAGRNRPLKTYTVM